MTSQIEFTAEGFSFVNDGTRYDVRTEVGQGTARVVVEQSDQQEQAMENSEENAA